MQGSKQTVTAKGTKDENATSVLSILRMVRTGLECAGPEVVTHEMGKVTNSPKRSPDRSTVMRCLMMGIREEHETHHVLQVVRHDVGTNRRTDSVEAYVPHRVVGGGGGPHVSAGNGEGTGET